MSFHIDVQERKGGGGGRVDATHGPCEKNIRRT